METNPTTRRSFRYWHKFAVVAVVGIVLLIASMASQNKYLNWGSAIVLVISGWYFVMSIFEFFDKVDD